ncbi:predicted protein [Naegleria gruberi]|uniref:Predicted protein n=1 Tax=Naegleria gruberi TaxID=5762 RepID=D2VVT5_NAEGR|nr:uncharacterized protein NAEGRDRAFT_73134 [Naegleria gruberi]EFC39096.1 predicted protein [Naegleria gruberi]|eukprot:XP_002671840.1 predicted protein [Naegleria gruberi strain NEG-M]
MPLHQTFIYTGKLQPDETKHTTFPTTRTISRNSRISFSSSTITTNLIISILLLAFITSLIQSLYYQIVYSSNNDNKLYSHTFFVNAATTCYGVDSTDPSVCSGNGNCTSKNNCECNDGFSGNKCQTETVKCYGVVDTDPTVCSGHGNCSSKNNCLCDSGYSGNKCQTFDGTSSISCYGIDSTDSSVCNYNGNCTATNNCVCNQGYSGNQCQTLDSSFKCYGVDSTDVSVCNGNGNCTSTNNCVCKSGYTGNQCQNEDSSFKCYGVDSTDISVCSGNGNCTSSNNCECKSGYTGNQCQSIDSSFKCYGVDSIDISVCNGNGNCTSSNNCVCKSGYSGNQCQTYDGGNSGSFKCYGVDSSDISVCSGNGNCTSANNCECKAGYSGNQCQTFSTSFKCYGVDSTDSSVCNGNGNCTSSNNCECKSGYTGNQCQSIDSSFKCYGVDSMDVSVCNGNGNCTSSNNCVCKSGYSGNQCQNNDGSSTIKCYGIDSTDPSVCSGHGICSSTNDCQCENGYSGNKCQTFANETSTFKCYGVDSSDPTVCSGNGNCTSTNNCQCQSGFSGNKCQTTVNYCFGYDENDNNVCGGPDRGKCTSNDVCECKGSYVGYDCGAFVSDKSLIKITSKYSKILSTNTDINFITISIPKLTNSYKGIENRLKSTLVIFSSNVTIDYSTTGMIEQFQLYKNMTLGVYSLNLTIVDTTYNIQVAATVESSIFSILTLEQTTQSVDTLTAKEIAQVTKQLNQITNQQQFISTVVSTLKENVNNYTIDDGLDLTSSLLDISNVKLDTKSKLGISETLKSYAQNMIEKFDNFTTEQVKPVAINIVSVASNILNQSIFTEPSSKFVVIGNSIQSVEKTLSLVTIVNPTENLSIETSMIKVLLISKSEYKNLHTIDKDYTLNLPELGFEYSFGLVKYENYLTEDLQNTSSISDILQVRPMLNGVFSPLRHLSTPFNLTFSIKHFGAPPSNETVATVVCKYWNETTNEWLSDGCSTTILSADQVLCSCYHTTKFSSFVDYSKVNFSTRTIQTSLAVANIIFSSLFIAAILVILVLLVIFRKSQPVKSRFITPYFALTALLIDNLVSGIIAKGLLLGNYSFNVVIMTSVCAVISSALLASAVWCYFVMSIRFIIHRYFYEYMMRVVENRQQKNAVLVKILNIFKQDKLLILSSLMIGFGFVLYFTIFIILKGVDAFSDSQFTYSTTISLFIILLFMTAMVIAIYILDFYLDFTNKQLRDELVDISDEIMLLESGDSSLNNLNSRKSLKITKPFVDLLEQSHIKKFFNLFYSNDKLMFRPEAIFFMLGISFFTISYCLGFASVHDRYVSNPTSTQIQTVDILDAVAFLFEVLMTVCLITSFGGFSVGWAIFTETRKRSCFKESRQASVNAERIKSQRLESYEDLTNRFDVYKLMKNKYLLRLFQQYAKLEMSLENYIVWMRIEHARSKFAKLWVDMDGEAASIEEWNSLLEELLGWLKDHLDPDAELALNVSHHSVKQFIAAVHMLESKIDTISTKNRDSLFNLKEMVRQAIDSLIIDVLYNLTDTYSRFIITDEYKALKEVESVTEMNTFK